MGWDFLWGQDWNVAELSFVLCLISTELISSAIALLFAFPIGLAVALVTSEDFASLDAITLAF